MPTKLKDCFYENGNLKFNPFYDRDDICYSIIFDYDGFLKSPDEIKDLINENDWEWDSEAVGMYHADILSQITGGVYPTYEYFKDKD